MEGDLRMEEWKAINGFENYFVSNEGRVYNSITDRFIGIKSSDLYKYKRVKLSKDGKVMFADVHRLVAEAFIPNKNKFEVVNHINGITTDNRVENLEWCSRSENQKHAYRIGLEKPQRGEDNKNSKLSKEQVLEIRRIYKKRDRERGGGALARRFGVSDEAIRRCVNGVTWKYT